MYKILKKYTGRQNKLLNITLLKSKIQKRQGLDFQLKTTEFCIGSKYMSTPLDSISFSKK